MDELNKIRKAYRDGSSINEIAVKYRRSWETVKRIADASTEDLENRGRRPNKERTVVTAAVEEAIEDYLNKEERLRVKKKQRYTSVVIYKELKGKGIYKGSVRQLQDTVKRLREKRGQIKSKSYLPLSFALGTTAQFDHGECVSVKGTHLSSSDHRCYIEPSIQTSEVNRGYQRSKESRMGGSHSAPKSQRKERIRLVSVSVKGTHLDTAIPGN